MQLTFVLELLRPTKRKENILFNNISEVAKLRREIVNKLEGGNSKLTSKHFKNFLLPSAVVNQNIREVKALYRLFKKSGSKKEIIEFKDNQPISFNNQNYKIDRHIVSFPVFNEKAGRIAFPVKQTERLKALHNHLNSGAKKGKASLFYRYRRWYFAVTVTINVNKQTHQNVMGIDIGLRQLAVASVSTPQGVEINRAFHSGRQAGFIRKKFRAVRRKLGQAKQLKAIKRLGGRECRWIRDVNHKISRQLVNLAVQERVGIIVMEHLKNIRETAYSLKSADRSLHSWTFYELQTFIEYKARAAGIEVVYINPAYTSQRCSVCGIVSRNQRKQNLYTCSCGNRLHADLNASRNIVNAYLEQQSA